MQQLELSVAEVIRETDLVTSLRLVATKGVALPQFTAGAHIRIALPDGDDRPYSLVVLEDIGQLSQPTQYRLGVRLDAQGAGGSRYMHSLSVGKTIIASAPKNDFALRDTKVPSLLLAGGIGITPIATMAAALKAMNAPYQLHYSGRSRGSLAFLDALRAVHGDNLVAHYDDDETALNLGALVTGASMTSQIYVCGPVGMIEAVREAAAARGIDKSHVHFELFAPKQATSGDSEFEVVVHSTGQVFKVPAGVSIIDALEQGGVDLTYDCRRGDCGICQTTVISGIPDHRDVILTDAERASNSVMQICVSRAKTPQLVLDI